VSPSLLEGKKILLGVTGSIAAYKTADWIRALRKEGADVTVVMTKAGARFVSPLTFAALSGNRVYSDMFEESVAEEIPHISLARNFDLIIVAPATAQTICRLAYGLADDLLSTVILASDAKVLVFPAMNSKMYLHSATQENLGKLRKFGYSIIEPGSGSMACGEEGPGRLVDWNAARQAILSSLAPQDLANLAVLVTAGPTQEALDPARFISNRSTGKMGFALAETAKQRGAAVTLVSGPTTLSPPPNVEFIPVTTAAEMHEAVVNRAEKMSVVVKAAAVSDYRPAVAHTQKLKKGEKQLDLTLKPNRDILMELGQHKQQKENFPLLVGFAAETQNHFEEGLRKLREKNLDMIAINDISGKDSGFEADTNSITLVDRDGTKEELPLLSKEEAAHRIWDSVTRLLSGRDLYASRDS